MAAPRKTTHETKVLIGVCPGCQEDVTAAVTIQLGDLDVEVSADGSASVNGLAAISQVAVEHTCRPASRPAQAEPDDGAPS